MFVLIACEESQEVCKAFRAKGHTAFSCDIEPCSGGHPEWHIEGDCLPVLNGNCKFTTADGKSHEINQKWDLMIAHPPCTFLTNSGNAYYNEERYGEKAVKRKADREDAIKFFMAFVDADCDKKAIENPIGVMSSRYQKPTQIIQPYQFGHDARKATCLWLKGLPKLEPTEIIEPTIIRYPSGRTISPLFVYTRNLPPKERAKARSKTFHNIAVAMAEQWG